MRRVVLCALFAFIMSIGSRPAEARMAALPLGFPGPVEVPAGLVVHADLIVAMRPSGPTSDVRGVFDALRRRHDVIRYARVSADELRNDLLAHADSPAFRRTIEKMKVPDQILVDLAHGAPRRDVEHALRGRAGVLQFLSDLPSWPTDVVYDVPPCEQLGYDAVVVMEVDAAPIQIDAVAGAIAARPDVRLVSHDDAAAALDRFRAVHSGDYPNVTEAHLADTFELQLAPGAMTDSLDGFHELAGVDDVVSSRHGCDRLAAQRYRLP